MQPYWVEFHPTESSLIQLSARALKLTSQFLCVKPTPRIGELALLLVFGAEVPQLPGKFSVTSRRQAAYYSNRTNLTASRENRRHKVALKRFGSDFFSMWFSRCGQNAGVDRHSQ